MAGPDAGQQLETRKAGDAVARVLGPAQEGQHVLDVGGLEEFEPAEFHERDVAARELDLERAAVVRGAKQHGLLLERDAGLAVLQDPLGDVARLVGLVAHGDQLRALGRGALGPQVLGEALGRELDDGVGGREDRLGRAVVALERDDLGGRLKCCGKVEDVAHGGGAERIDRLRVVADDGEAAPFGLSASRIEACRRLVS